jgi:SRSO17 transposase
MSATQEPAGRDAPPLELSEKDVKQLAEELVEYHRVFRDLYFRKEQSHWALKYIEGLLLPGRNKSVETLALTVEGVSVRPLQRFIGEGAWDDEAVLRKHRQLVAESLGDPDGVLIVDGSDFPKKGKYSAGVARQYCGATGKVDNCQAGVFLGYASDRGHTLLDRRLYLHRSWFELDSRERWERCEIPDDVTFRTKPQLAWDMIEATVADSDLAFSWITCDEAFGDNFEFLKHLEESGIRYLADVSISTLVWLERPETVLPPAKATGRPPSRERLTPDAPEPIRVDEVASELPADAWQRYKVKDGAKGAIEADFAFVPAVTCRDKLPGPDILVVFRRSLSQPREVKVFIANVPADTSREELVRVSGMRWPIETCFDEAKGNLGMDEYQTRSWCGWHHHMTLVILAHHFLVLLKLKHKKGHQRLLSHKSADCSRPSCPDRT